MPSRREPKYTYAPGDIIGGKYRVTGVVGAGGMATVYRAIDTTIDKIFAVKVLHERNAPHHAYSLAQIQSEARTLVKIRDDTPFVVEVVTAGITEDRYRLPYYVMELLVGRTSRTIIARRKRLEKAMPFSSALHIAKAVAMALHYAHKRGIVHRDVTPANVFVCEHEGDEPIPKLIDFGIAGHSGDKSKENLAYKGTPSNSSPEQFREEDVSAAMDIYGLGVLLFELVALEHPFPTCRTREEFAAAHLNTPAPRLSSIRPDVPRALDDLVASALEKDPAKRPPTALDFVEWIDQIRATLGAGESLRELTVDAEPAAAPPPEEHGGADQVHRVEGDGVAMRPGVETSPLGAIADGRGVALSSPRESKDSLVSFYTNPAARGKAVSIRALNLPSLEPTLPPPAPMLTPPAPPAEARAQATSRVPADIQADAPIIPMGSVILGPPVAAASSVASVEVDTVYRESEFDQRSEWAGPSATPTPRPRREPSSPPRPAGTRKPARADVRAVGSLDAVGLSGGSRDEPQRRDRAAWSRSVLAPKTLAVFAGTAVLVLVGLVVVRLEGKRLVSAGGGGAAAPSELPLTIAPPASAAWEAPMAPSLSIAADRRGSSPEGSASAEAATSASTSASAVATAIQTSVPRAGRQKTPPDRMIDTLDRKSEPLPLYDDDLLAPSRTAAKPPPIAVTASASALPRDDVRRWLPPDGPASPAAITSAGRPGPGF